MLARVLNVRFWGAQADKGDSPSGVGGAALEICVYSGVCKLIGTAVLSFASSQPQSVPRLALIEIAQREQDLASLAPQRGLIAAQPIERVGRQV